MPMVVVTLVHEKLLVTGGICAWKLIPYIENKFTFNSSLNHGNIQSVKYVLAELIF